MGGLKIKSDLLYKGSRDGWNFTDFHKKCDNKGATLTIFVCNNGKRCGGFTSECWDIQSGWK